MLVDLFKTIRCNLLGWNLGSDSVRSNGIPLISFVYFPILLFLLIIFKYFGFAVHVIGYACITTTALACIYVIICISIRECIFYIVTIHICIGCTIINILVRLTNIIVIVVVICIVIVLIYIIMAPNCSNLCWLSCYLCFYLISISVSISISRWCICIWVQICCTVLTTTINIGVDITICVGFRAIYVIVLVLILLPGYDGCYLFWGVECWCYWWLFIIGIGIVLGLGL